VPAVAGAVPLYVAMPEGFNATVCVAEPMLKTTLPVGVAEPLAGATEAVNVYDSPAANVPPLGVIDRAVVVEMGEGNTVTPTVALAVNAPEVPVTVAKANPGAAELLAVSVSTLVAVVGFVPHDAVTPLGSPVAARVTLPVKPATGVTVIVDVLEAPWLTDT